MPRPKLPPQAATPARRAPAVAKPKPAAAPSAAAPPAACPCPCHEAIPAHKYACWGNCHLVTLGTQRGTLTLWAATAVLFVAFNMLWHGVLLMDRYVATAPLWLPQDQMQPGLFWLADALIALVFALLFRLAYTGLGGWVEGLKLGTLIMAPLALINLYVLGTQPIPAAIVGLWALGAVTQGALAGVLAAFLTARSKACGPQGCC